MNMLTLLAVVVLITGCQDSEGSRTSQRPLAPANNAHSKISGYQDLKFGMSYAQIGQLNICAQIYERNIDHSSGFLFVNGYACYEVNGLRRSMTFWFPPGTDALSRIDVWFGEFAPDTFHGLKAALDDRYPISYEFTQDEVRLFDGGRLPKIFIGYANYQVTLEISKTKGSCREGYGQPCPVLNKMFVTYRNNAEASEIAAYLKKSIASGERTVRTPPRPKSTEF